MDEISYLFELDSPTQRNLEWCWHQSEYVDYKLWLKDTYGVTTQRINYRTRLINLTFDTPEDKIMFILTFG